MPFVYIVAHETRTSLHSLLVLFFSQSLAALYSCFEFTFTTPQIFLGAVTEGGQLSLAVVAAFGLLFLSRGNKEFLPVSYSREHFIKFAIMSACILFILCAVLLSLFPNPLFLVAGVVVLLLVGVYIVLSFSKDEERFIFALFLTALFLTLGLIVNMKRGPWVGVFCACSLLILKENPKQFALLLLGLAFCVLIFPPLYERLASSREHFFIHGGRNEIWDIAWHLARQFPTGIGLKNSNFLQQFSQEVPENLTHFHSNYLNILVETGWIGILLFLFWLYSLVRPLLFYCIGKSVVMTPQIVLGFIILSWSIAGVVEYSFGDTEVLYLLLVYCGLFLSFEEGKEDETVSSYGASFVES